MAEKRLYDAAAKGDEKALQELHQEDPLLLNRVSYTSPNKTPLHIATIHGHLPFVEQILNHNPHLAEELDSQQSSARHVASAKGYVEIVKKLLSAAPDTCMPRDSQGRNPLHLAAIKGHVRVLEELFRVAPFAAREKVDGGLSLLHLCVKYSQFEALKMLVPMMNQLLNWKDDDGDTILHVAVRDNRIEIIKYLVENTNIDVNAKNSKGQTPVSILDQTPPDTISEIRKILASKLCNSNINTQTKPVKWLTRKRDAIMVVAILIETMAFQVGVNPPGGVWENDSDAHNAGEAIMAHHHPTAYRSFIRSNTVAFASSLGTILLLISGLPFRHRLFMWILMVNMWLAVTSIALTYAISIGVVTPREDKKSLINVVVIGLVVWCSVMGILLGGNTVRLIDMWLKNRGVIVWRPTIFRKLVYDKNSQESV